jgi:hypothetical protein
MKSLSVFLFFLSLVVSGVHAADKQSPKQTEAPEELVNRYRWRIDQTLKDVRKVDPDCETCGLFMAGTGEAPSPKCRDTYKKLFKIQDSLAKEKKSDTEIDMRVVFGYMDFGNAVEDRYAMAALITQLGAPCGAGQFACGFGENPDDAGDFRKHISILGPDGRPRSRLVHIRLRSSSVSPDETQNRTTSKLDQDDQTDETRAFYLDGLENADVSLYVGHARDGGGPDFGPPVVNSKLHRTDYDWYHKHHPGLDAMSEAFDGAPMTS